MKAVIQRVNFAKLRIDQQVFSKIKNGLVVLVGITHNDDIDDIKWLVRKILNLRIFDDDKSVMNKSIIDVKGEVLIVSQFTLTGNFLKGNRPSFVNAKNPDIANEMFNKIVQKFSIKIKTKTGQFGSMMQVGLINDGPSTFVLTSKNGKIIN